MLSNSVTRWYILEVEGQQFEPSHSVVPKFLSVKEIGNLYFVSQKPKPLHCLIQSLRELFFHLHYILETKHYQNKPLLLLKSHLLQSLSR